MVRIGGRSKGCATCLKRKIRCDEKVPECSQCLNGGRKCPGPVSGMVFLSVTQEQNSTTREKADRQPLTRHDKLPVSNSQVPCYPEGCALTMEANTCISDISLKAQAGSPSLFSGGLDGDGLRQGISQEKQSSPPLSRDTSLQINSQQIFRQQALSHFINFFAKNPPTKSGTRSWMYLLPDMLSSETFPAVKTPIVAASVIYFGSLTNVESVVIEGYKWYGLSLERQRRQLQLSSHRNTPPTVEEICMPIMLSFFEVICSTSPTAYFQHIIGAAKLLEGRGPEACKSGTFHQLFKTVRVQMIYPSVTIRVASIFATERWRTIPFLGRPKTIFDRVVDVLTYLPVLLSHLDRSVLSMNSPISSIGIYAQQLGVKRLKDDLDILWKDLRAEATGHGWGGDYFQGTIGFDFDHPNSTPCSSTGLRHPYTSLTIAFYSTARILVLSTLSQITSPLLLYEEQVIAHSASILHAAEILEDHHIGCAYIRLILPLKVVGLSSPCMAHRTRVRQFLDSWRMQSGMGGICEVVLSEMQKETQGGCHRTSP